MIIATAGHVDHGKTSLVHCLTGIETDRLEEEKSRGLTIDLGFAYIEQKKQTIGFVDVPGHIKFINNMLTGVSTIDFAMLVIAADDGPMPQTREHLAILNIMGIGLGCIVLTKVDKVDTAKIAEVKNEIKNLVASTCLDSAPIFEVSCTQNQGIEPLSDHLWKMSKDIEQRQVAGHFRLAIDRCFSIKGSGTVVTGSVFSGEIKVGDEVFHLPSKRPLRIRGIHRQNENAEKGQAGDRCAINLTGDIDRSLISRGHWLSSNVNLPFSNRIDTKFTLLNSETKPLKNWTPVHVHAAAQHVTGRIATLENKSISPGQSSLVQLVLSEPINVCYGDKIVVRDQSAERTLGGAHAIDPYAPSRGRAKPTRLYQLESMLEESLETRLSKLLSPLTASIHLSQTLSNFNLRSLDSTAFGDLDAEGYLFAAEHVEEGRNSILAGLEKWNKNFPNGKPPTINQLANLIQLPKALYKHILVDLIGKKLILQDGQSVQLVGQQKQMSKSEQTFWDSIKPILNRDPLKPPVLHELSKMVQLPPIQVDKQLKNCIAYGVVLKPVKNRFFLPEAISTLKEMVIALSKDKPHGQFTVIDFRDKSTLGRNLCIEILEYFDQIGFTRRIGDCRVLQDINR
ncbi:MAG: selenocysteine-specific elongation factor [Candidatus Azotimanducaceae bacterium]|jgi:selenocysteine-specific elongation factor